jgi:MFS family permease
MQMNGFRNTETGSNNLKLIFFANFIEFADLYIFIHCAPMIAKIFIPPEYQSWMTTFAVSVAYGIPPIAAILFARLGDDWGRKVTLVLSSTLMFVLTVVLVCLPSYEQIGMWSLIIFCLIRFFQAISIAGEGSCAWIYAYESTPKFSQTAFTIPFISLGEMLSGVISLGGFLFLFHYLSFLGEEQIIRCMFGFLAILFAFVLHNRKRLEETKIFLIERQKFHTGVSFRQLYQQKQFLNKNWWSLVGIMLIYPLGFTISYVFMGDVLKNQLGYSDHDVVWHNMFVAIAELTLVFLTGCAFCHLENKKILNRKFSYLMLSAIPLVCSGFAFFYLSLYEITALKIWMIQVFMVMPLNSAFIIGNFYHEFPVIGRFTSAASAWSTARLIGLVSGIWIMQYIHGQQSLYYFVVFAVFSIIQILCIVLAREPNVEYGR